MLPLLIGLVLIITGLGAVAWLMWNESKQTSAQEPQNIPEDKKEKKSPPVTPSALLQKLGLQETRPVADSGAAKKKSFLPSFPWPFKKSQKESLANGPTLFPTELPEEFNQVLNRNNPNLNVGTASLRLDQGLPTGPIHTQGLEGESDWTFKYEDLQKDRDSLKEKFDRLDTLFKEKGEAFDKTEKALANEVKNRKEFNKVKDVLEKELKESKDKYRELEIQLTAAQTEAGSYLKRVNQLEEKIKKLEKTILKNEEAGKEAQGQIQGRQKLIAELEEKLKAHERLIEEKNQKINEIVGHLKDKEGKKEEAKAGEGGVETPSFPVEVPAAPALAEPAPPAAAEAASASEPAPVETTQQAPEAQAQAESPKPAKTSNETASVPAQSEPPSEPQSDLKSEPQMTQAAHEAETTPPVQPPIDNSAMPTGKEKPAVPERGNIILQAIENPTPETSTAESAANPEAPLPAAQKNNPSGGGSDVPILKLAPDILEKQHQELKKNLDEPVENPENKTAPQVPQNNPETDQQTT